ncbi:MAG: hypothetical protein EXQ58_03695 [Acidobacteria bacterium]|nr:hypothetical protein [Acidobacteriota bacterium]
MLRICMIRIVSAVVFGCVLAATVAAQTESVSQFLWKRNNSRGLLESYGIELDSNGNGQFCFKKRNDVEIKQPVKLRASAFETLRALFQKADFFDESRDFVSQRKVADMGSKTVRFETGSKQREVVYNYTEDRTLQEITTFFENLCQQERALFEMDLALKYDRLGIPKKLDELGTNLNAKRIIAPERFEPVLEKIYADQTLMNLARKEAKKLLVRIEKMKTF